MTTINPIRWALGAALALALVLPALAADKMTSQERSNLIAELQESRELTVRAVSGLSEDQLHFQSGPFRWSIAQTLEHIAKGEQLLAGLVTEQMMQALEEGAPEQQPQERSEAKPVDAEEILRWLVARETSVQAPQRVRPTNAWGSPAATLKAFTAKRDQVIEFVSTTEKDLHRAVRPNVVFGPLDACQWLYFTSGHVRRHLAQIEEIKAHPDFPSH